MSFLFLWGLAEACEKNNSQGKLFTPALSEDHLAAGLGLGFERGSLPESQNHTMQK